MRHFKIKLKSPGQQEESWAGVRASCKQEAIAIANTYSRETTVGTAFKKRSSVAKSITATEYYMLLDAAPLTGMF
ncbi:hypothetical protein [Pontibacter pamirensis]|uniref:hypothetical protein n=1 Tax=Pontibacter pamirensis TaxID=2562824 RepID=UPI00138A027A|nr:hypothetical protein [Pontibacter pamirensis]